MNKNKATFWLLIFSILITFFSMIIPSRNAYLLLGAQWGPLFEYGQWYRLFTALFLHAGLLHLLFNMYALWILGNYMENFYGTWRFLVVYFTSGLVGNLATQFFYYNTISLGASGAIFGLAGAIFVSGYRSDYVAFKRYSMGLLPFIIINIVWGFMGSYVNNAAHIGGLLTGLALGYFISPGIVQYYLTFNDFFKREFWTHPWYAAKRREAIWLIIGISYVVLVVISYVLLFVDNIR